MVTGVDDREANINKSSISPSLRTRLVVAATTPLLGEVKVTVLDSGTTPEQPGGDSPVSVSCSRAPYCIGSRGTRYGYVHDAAEYEA